MTQLALIGATMKITVVEIIEDWLKEHGFDGLFDGDECACAIGDILPCAGVSGYIPDCMPGYRMVCDCDYEEHDFHIGPHKPDKKEE